MSGHRNWWQLPHNWGWERFRPISVPQLQRKSEDVKDEVYQRLIDPGFASAQLHRCAVVPELSSICHRDSAKVPTHIRGISLTIASCACMRTAEWMDLRGCASSLCKSHSASRSNVKHAECRPPPVGPRNHEGDTSTTTLMVGRGSCSERMAQEPTNEFQMLVHQVAAVNSHISQGGGCRLWPSCIAQCRQQPFREDGWRALPESRGNIFG